MYVCWFLYQIVVYYILTEMVNKDKLLARYQLFYFLTTAK